MYRPNDPANLTAFNHFYNLEYDSAVQEFEQIRERHPNDPFAVNHLLTAVMLRELYRMGVLNPAEYADDSFWKTAHLPVDPRVRKKIQDLVSNASGLEDAQLAAHPNDIDSLYARGVTRAEFAAYTGLAEHAWFSALRNAVAARRDHERVLALAPEDTPAMLIVGAHNYVVGNLPWSLKAAGSILGLGGNKEKGLNYLRLCAAGNGETSIDAKILLVLFLRREHSYDEALTIARALIPAYPHNLLMALEEANLLRAEGRDAEAAVVYRRIWQNGKQGRYSGLHYEAAALSLGDALRNQKDFAGAAAAYGEVGGVPDPDREMLQKANLGAGEMADLANNRDLALRKYLAVVASGSGTPQADTARKHLKDPYRGEGN
jgi:hypothetical protein